MRVLEEGAVNASNGMRLAGRVRLAETPRERMRGLLGRPSLPAGEGLLLDPCRAVHTVGMRFPIDVLFLDRSGRVVRAAGRIRPHRPLLVAPRARRVLELPAGTLESTGTKEGDRIRFKTREEGDGAGRIRRRLGNLSLGLLFGVLAGVNLTHLFSVPTVGGAALFLINGLSALLFCIRKKAGRVTRRWTDWGLTLATLIMPWGLRTVGDTPGSLTLLGSVIQAAGLLVVLCALFHLSRSFGLAPANRGLVDRGPYRWIRHPMYAGELLCFLGFALANPTVWNEALLFALLVGLPLRALAEERLLLNDGQYRAYADRVPWRFLPAVL